MKEGEREFRVLDSFRFQFSRRIFYLLSRKEQSPDSGGKSCERRERERESICRVETRLWWRLALIRGGRQKSVEDRAALPRNGCFSSETCLSDLISLLYVAGGIYIYIYICIQCHRSATGIITALTNCRGEGRSR